MYTGKKKTKTTQEEISGLRSGQMNLKENDAAFQVRNNKFPFLQQVCIMQKAVGLLGYPKSHHCRKLPDCLDPL